MAARPYIPLIPAGTANRLEHLEDVTELHQSTAGQRSFCRISNDRLPVVPPSELTFDLFFFRRIFAELEKAGHTKHGKVHISVLRNVSVRLMDAIGLSGLTSLENGFFGMAENSKTWYTWKDICQELREKGHPRVPLNLPEMIFMTLENADTSFVAKWTSLAMMVIILANLALIVLQSLPEDTCRAIIPGNLDFGHGCASEFQTYCIYVFSFEYFVKLCTCSFVRLELFDQELLLREAVPGPMPSNFGEREALGKVQRFLYFIFNPANLIDLISILPWWITQFAGRILPGRSTSFLRVIRIARILRVFKTGRYVQNVQVLGSVLASSGRSVGVLMLFITVIALIGGVLLSHFESHGFENIPFAMYWTFAQLIGLKNAPLVHESVETTVGVVLLGVVVSLKGVLWILPIGQIKSAFDSLDKANRDAQQMRETMEYELTKPDWTNWYGLASSVRIHFDIYRSVSSGPKSTSWGTPITRASMPVPILEPKAIQHRLEVPLRSGLKSWLNMKLTGWPHLVVKLDWLPMKDMMQAVAPVEPHGTLTLFVENGHNWPDSENHSYLIAVRVPLDTGPHGSHTREVASKTGGRSPVFNEHVEFPINWNVDQTDQHTDCSSPSGLDVVKNLFAPGRTPTNSLCFQGAPLSLHEDTGISGDDVEFRKSVLSYLEAQSCQLAEQSKRLISLEGQLASLKSSHTH